MAISETTEDSAMVLCACNTVQLLQRCRLLSPEPCPPIAPSWTYWLQLTRFRESCSSASMSCESKILKKSSSNWLNSGNALIQRVKNGIFVLAVLPASAETQVIWGGVVMRLLIAYFIGSISGKIYQNPFRCIKVIASQRWDVFWDTVYNGRKMVVVTFRVRRSRGEMYVGHSHLCVSVWLSLAAFPHYCTDPDVRWGMVVGVL